jgi:hypothetical protein
MLMYWLLWRDLTVFTRIRALWIVMAAQTLFLSAVLTTWGDGIPALTGNIVEQFARVHFALSVPLLSWIAARCSGSRQNEFAVLAAAAATSPFAVIGARAISLFVVLAIMSLTTLPLYLIAVRMTNGALGDAAMVVTNLSVLLLFVSAVVTTSLANGQTRMVAWLGTAALALVVTALVPPHLLGMVLLVLTTMTCAAVIPAGRRPARVALLLTRRPA